jgi:hypothetical protein
VPGGGFGTSGGRFETADTMWVIRAGVNSFFFITSLAVQVNASRTSMRADRKSRSRVIFLSVR